MMLIKKIRLKNIRSYVDATIDFPKGSTLLAGDIGSGKSTILLAIEFALFGLKRGELSGETLLRAGAKEGNVEVTFDLDAKEVVLSRNLLRAKDSIKQEAGFIAINGQKEDMTPVELKAKIFELFGYPLELVSKGKDIIFRYTVYTPQEDMKRIIMDDPESRLDTLRVVFQIDKYKKIQDNASVLSREMKARFREHSAKAQDLEKKKLELSLAREQHESKKALLEKASLELARLNSGLESKKKDIKLIEGNLKSYRELRSRFDVMFAQAKEKSDLKRRLQEQALKFKAQQSDLSSKAKDIEIIEIDYDDESIKHEIKKESDMLLINVKGKQKAELDLASLVKDLERLEKLELSIAEKGISSSRIKERVAQIKKDASLETNIKKIESELEETKRQIATLESEINSSNRLKIQVLELENCPICLQKVDSNHKAHITKNEDSRLNDLGTKLNHLLGEEKILSRKRLELLAQKQKQLEEEKLEASLLAELKGIENEISESIQKKQEIPKIKQDIASLKSKIEGLKGFDEVLSRQNIDSLNRKLAIIAEQRSKQKEKEQLFSLAEKARQEYIRSQKDASDLEIEIESMKSKLKDMQSELESMKGLQASFDSAKEDLETWQLKVSDAGLKKVSYEKELEGISNMMASFEQDVKEKEAAMLYAQKMKRISNWIDDYFISLVGLIEKQVMSSIHYEFNSLFKQWFSMLIEDTMLQARLDDDFTPIVEQSGYQLSIQNLSGGEKTSCALAYRLSLNRVINDMITTIRTKDMIILDEPTDGFSTEQLDRVRLVLDELKMKQILIVSHEAKIESFVSNILRVAKVDGESKILN